MVTAGKFNSLSLVRVIDVEIESSKNIFAFDVVTVTKPTTEVSKTTAQKIPIIHDLVANIDKAPANDDSEMNFIHLFLQFGASDP